MDECISLDMIDSWEYVDLDEVCDISIRETECYHLDCGVPILVHNSGKTFSVLEFFIYLALFYGKPLVINIVKETYNEFKTTLYDDWSRLLDYYDLPNPFYKQEVHIFRINGSKINLIGADGKSGKSNKFHGKGCDILYFNEGLGIAQSIFDQSEMRCRMFWIIDYNPSVTEHYIFKSVIPRPEVGFLRTTFLDNKHISIEERNKILSYEPWLPGSYEVHESIVLYNGKPVDENNQPPPHKVNIENGTADEFMWKVYGLGLRGAMKGLIFPHVTYIDEFPDDIAYTYGVDFGFTTDPLTVVKGGEDTNNIYLELLWYSPVESPHEIDMVFQTLGMSKDTPITADSSDRHLREGQKEAYHMVRDLFNLGWEISKVRKSKTIMFWLASMKTKKIHIVRKGFWKEAKVEQENYRLKEINGIPINQPDDKHNHCFTGDTYIQTSIGQKRVDNIVQGDLVLTSNGYESVVELFNNGVKEIYSFWIRFDTFSLNLKSTKDHLVKTNDGWVKISELKQGQIVYLSKNLTEKHINCITEKNISAEEQKKCTGSFGNFTTEPDQKDFMSTTKTPIHTIIESKISSLLMEATTLVCTLKIELIKTLFGLKNFMRRGLNRQKSGTNHLKGLNGIKNTQKISNSDKKRMDRENVKYAQRSSWLKRKHKDSAKTVVNQSSGANLESITSQKIVSTVQRNSHQTNTSKSDFAVKFVVDRIDSEKISSETVYDLAVNNTHEYFANGILVHNCWDAARYNHMSHNTLGNLTEEWD